MLSAYTRMHHLTLHRTPASQVESPAAVVLHYPYARFSEMRAKAARSCPFTAAAAAGNRSAIEACFVMGFDADIFMAANSGAGAEAALRRIFRERIALPPATREAQLRTGLLRRVHAPAVALAQQERAVRWLRRSGGALLEGLRDAPAPPPLSAAQEAQLDAELAYLAWHA
jgi:hypothetical protein